MNLEEIKNAIYDGTEEEVWGKLLDDRNRLIHEVERLQEAIKDLNALRRNDRQLFQDIEAKYIKRVQELEKQR